MSGYLDGFEWVENSRNAGGTYDPEGYGYPWRLVLHTMEGWLSRGSAAGHPYPPHLWYSPRTRQRLQTVPLDRAAFALYQGNYGTEYTNKARAIQVEIEGFAAETAGWSEEWLRNLATDLIAPIVRWCQSKGITLDLGNVPDIGAIGGSASEYAPQRMAESTWRWFNGVCSHRHVPYNDHWDTGGLNIARVAQLTAEVLGTAIGPAPGLTPPQTVEEELEVYPFYERLGPGFGWEGFNGECYALDSALVKPGDKIIVSLAYPGRDRTVKLNPPSGRRDNGMGDMTRLVRWGMPGVFVAEEEGFHSVVVESDGRGWVRAEGRKG